VEYSQLFYLNNWIDEKGSFKHVIYSSIEEKKNTDDA
jgi:hypothetical protein